LIKVEGSELGILFSVFATSVVVSFMSILNTASAQQHILPNMDIRINFPYSLQQNPFGNGITIFGTSTDNATSECQVSVVLNNIRPYQKAMATGPGGENDYSTWFFMYYSKTSDFIKNGNNEITAKLSCYFAPLSLTKDYSINITANGSDLVSTKYLTSIKKENSTSKANGEPSGHLGSYNTKTINEDGKDPTGTRDLVLPTLSLKTNNNSFIDGPRDDISSLKVDEQKNMDSHKSGHEDISSSHSMLSATLGRTADMAGRGYLMNKTSSLSLNNSTFVPATTHTPSYNNSRINNGSSNTSASSSSKPPSNSTYNLKIDSKKTIPIEYQISGNGNKLNSITVQKDNTTLLTSISSQSDGKLIVELPRKIIDSKKQGNKDTDYAVFQDGQDAAADEIKNNNQVRTLAISFDKGTQEIEIIGTQIVPEFGNIAIITMMFAMAIVALAVTCMMKTLREHDAFQE
jgi:hypothetical protein